MNSLPIRRMMEALGTFTATSLKREYERCYGTEHSTKFSIGNHIAFAAADGLIESVPQSKPRQYRWIKPPANKVEIVDKPGPAPVDLTDFSHPETPYWKDRAKEAKETDTNPQTRGHEI